MKDIYSNAIKLAENFAQFSSENFADGNLIYTGNESGIAKILKKLSPARNQNSSEEQFSSKPFGGTTTKNAGVAKPVGVSADANDHSKQAPAHDADAPKWTGHSEEGTENTENAENTEAFAESKPLNNLKKNANTNTEANKFAELNQKETGLPSPANNSINYELRGNDIEQWIKSAKDM